CKKDRWWHAARSGVDLPASHLLQRPAPSYPPPHKLWSKKYPQAWTRYQALRAAVTELSEQLAVPTENLLQPSLLRRWIWEHEEAGAAETVRERSEEHTSELQSRFDIVCRLLHENKNYNNAHASIC